MSRIIDLGRKSNQGRAGHGKPVIAKRAVEIPSGMSVERVVEYLKTVLSCGIDLSRVGSKEKLHIEYTVSYRDSSNPIVEIMFPAATSPVPWLSPGQVGRCSSKAEAVLKQAMIAAWDQHVSCKGIDLLDGTKCHVNLERLPKPFNAQRGIEGVCDRLMFWHDGKISARRSLPATFGLSVRQDEDYLDPDAYLRAILAACSGLPSSMFEQTSWAPVGVLAAA